MAAGTSHSPRQLAALTASLRAAATSPLLIAIDQEGGRVSRLNPAMGFPATRTEAAIGATGDPAVALAAGRAMGATMAAGIDLDLAPVVDVDVNPKNPAIGALGRSFSADPSAIVAAMAEAEIRGLHEAGVRGHAQALPGPRQRRRQHGLRRRRRDRRRGPETETRAVHDA